MKTLVTNEDIYALLHAPTASAGWSGRQAGCCGSNEIEIETIAGMSTEASV